MSDSTKRSTPQVDPRVLGSKAFAAISAVEGLKLSAAGKKRLRAMDEQRLTPDQRRAEVIRAYMEIKGRG